jgi:hypothetical protein
MKNDKANGNTEDQINRRGDLQFTPASANLDLVSFFPQTNSGDF